MGVTYKAFDVHLQRPAALKIINAQLLGNGSAPARFVREARAAASVRHQNVASVFHIGESGGNCYYAMELVEGESLAALIRRLGYLGSEGGLKFGPSHFLKALFMPGKADDFQRSRCLKSGRAEHFYNTCLPEMLGADRHESWRIPCGKGRTRNRYYGPVFLDPETRDGVHNVCHVSKPVQDIHHYESGLGSRGKRRP
jgi:hypothetical protein